MCMIPDVCVVKGPPPKEPVLAAPPLVSIEILSPENRLGRAKKTMQDCGEFGVPYVSVIDPETLESGLHDESGTIKPGDGVLRIPGTPIEVPLPLLDED